MGIYIVKTFYNLEEAKKEWPEKTIGKSTNYTGKIFKDFKAIYRCEQTGHDAMWVLQCQNCGCYVRKTMSSFIRKETQQCNCSKSIIGKTFYYITVLENTSKRASNGGLIVKCKCNICNNIFEAEKGKIIQGQYKSCGCLNKSDLKNVHQKNGRLTGLEPTDQKNNSGSIIWKCRCDCGKICFVSTGDFNSEKVRSCGCLAKENIIKISKETRDIVAKKLTKDWSNQKINNIIIINKAYSNNRGVYWNCKCPFCNTIFQARPIELIERNRYSCGCQTMSNNEYKISSLLKKDNINFIYNLYIKEIKLKFDFYINNNNYAIEFDGSQHFKYTGGGWDTKDKFKKTRQRDLIKNKYCFDNNIPLIRIPYDVEYTIDDLKLETTRFLLTPENEEEYYKNRE